MSRSVVFSASAFLCIVCLARCGGNDGDSGQTGALVLTSDFQSGSVSAIDLDTREAARNIATAHSDASCKSDGGQVFVINRIGQDNIQVHDPAQNYKVLRQFSTGNGSNPQDICLVSDEKAYVPLYGASYLLVLNPKTGAELKRIDLGSAADPDGIPEASACAVNGNRAYVTLQNLTNFVPSSQSRIAILDTTNDTLLGTEKLQAQNPYTRLVLDKAGKRLLIGSSGFFGAPDGGIEAVSLDTGKSLGLIATEQELGGDVGAIALYRSDKAFAIVVNSSFATSIVSFNPQTGKKLKTIFSSEDPNLSDSDFDLWTIALNDRDELYAADTNLQKPGVRVFDADTDQALAQQPIDVGLPPRDICFSGE